MINGQSQFGSVAAYGFYGAFQDFRFCAFDVYFDEIHPRQPYQRNQMVQGFRLVLHGRSFRFVKPMGVGFAPSMKFSRTRLLHSAACNASTRPPSQPRFCWRQEKLSSSISTQTTRAAARANAKRANTPTCAPQSTTMSPSASATLLFSYSRPTKISSRRELSTPSPGVGTEKWPHGVPNTSMSFATEINLEKA